MIMSCSCGRVASGPMPASQAQEANRDPDGDHRGADERAGLRAQTQTRRARIRATSRGRASRTATAAAPTAAVTTSERDRPEGQADRRDEHRETPATATDAAGARATMSSPGGTASAASSTSPGTYATTAAATKTSASLTVSGRRSASGSA